MDLGEAARGIIDSNVYMVLGTVDEDGRPWTSPVFYAAGGYREFYWISSPEVTHSRNLARDPRLSIVIFNSQAVVGTGGQYAVYMAGTAEQLAGADVERGLEHYPGPAERGARAMTKEDLAESGPYRLYRATVSEHSMLCPRSGGPCEPHGLAYDHRTAVSV